MNNTFRKYDKPTIKSTNARGNYRGNTSTLEKSFVIQSLKIWNGLPEQLNEIRNYNNFKLRVKTEVLLQKLNFPQ